MQYVCFLVTILIIFIVKIFKIGKERFLNHDACCISQYLGGDFLLIGGSNKKVNKHCDYKYCAVATHYFGHSYFITYCMYV